MLARNPHIARLSKAEVGRLESIIESFEQSWERGERPDLDSYLDQATDLRDAAAVELAASDLEYRIRAGEPARAEDYVQNHPEWRFDAAIIGELLATELAMRPGLSRAEIAARFPDVADRLSQLLPAESTPNEQRTANAEDRRQFNDARPTVAGYELFERLGAGGMGIVYKARHLALNRIVALKLLRIIGSDGLMTRFRAEAETVAHLNHPNIVQVYEVGENHGCPFLALEFVAGGSLADQLARGPMTANDAATLVESLAAAVSYAHNRGIIHRDLKPGNILLQISDCPIPIEGSSVETQLQCARDQSAIADRQSAIPKIADFGLAKRLDMPDGPTRSGEIIGTPSYMAPELASGNANESGTLCDVYSLGAILYECLTGRPPFRAATALETLDQIRRMDPVAPRVLQPSVPLDLQTIVLKCLEKTPAKRYSSAADLADDLKRYRAGLPISARSPGRIERIWKWTRRRPAAATAIGISALAVCALFAMAFAFTVRLRDERDTSDRERVRAEESYRAARRAIDQGIDRIKDDPRLKRGDLDDLRRALLQAESNFFEEFLRIRKDDPNFAVERAETLHRLGAYTADFGSKEKAIEYYRMAADIERNLPSELAAEPARRSHLALIQHFLGTHLHALARDDQARIAYRESETIYEGLVNKIPDNPAHAYDLANLLVARCVTDRDLGDLNATKTGLDHAEQIVSKLIEKYPDNAAYVFRLGSIHGDRANLLVRMKRSQEAELEMNEALRLVMSAVRLDPGNDEYRYFLAIAHLNLGIRHRAAGRYEQSLKELLLAEPLYEELLRKRPTMTQYRDGVANCQRRLGITLRGMKKFDQAEEHFRHSLAATEPLLREQPNVIRFATDFGNAGMHFGAMLNESGRSAEAIEPLNRGIEALEKAFQLDAKNANARTWLYQSLWERGLAKKTLGQWAEAGPDYDRAIELCNEPASVLRLHVQRAETRSHCGDNVGTLADVAEAQKLKPAGDMLIFLAAVCVRAGDAASTDMALSEADRATGKEHCSLLAIELLRSAKELGYLNSDGFRQVENSPMLQSLRDRQDYRKLFAETSR